MHIFSQKIKLSGPEVVDISAFLTDPKSSEALDACKRIAKTLEETSCLIIKDPRYFIDRQ
jgi:hypothetical protein